jgi:hypothetical protein
MKMNLNLRRGMIAAGALAALGFAVAPAQAKADVSIGVSLGSPYYYAPPPPPPRYYESRVVYEEPYYETRVVHERHYYPSQHVYYRHDHRHHHRHHRHHRHCRHH